MNNLKTHPDVTAPEKIDEESWDWSFGCMYPARWKQRGKWDSFHLAELYSHDIAYWFASDGSGNFYKFRDRVNLTDKEFTEKMEKLDV